MLAIPGESLTALGIAPQPCRLRSLTESLPRFTEVSQPFVVRSQTLGDGANKGNYLCV